MTSKLRKLIGTATFNQMLKEAGLKREDIENALVPLEEAIRRLGYEPKLIDRGFDVKVRMSVEVLPKQVPFSIGEEIIWNGISNEVDYEAQKIGHTFEEYFENMVEDIMRRRGLKF